jgi:hypothetical protein
LLVMVVVVMLERQMVVLMMMVALTPTAVGWERCSAGGGEAPTTAHQVSLVEGTHAGK